MNHVVVGLSENLDSLVSGALGVLHDHGDVVLGEAVFWEWLLVLVDWGGGGSNLLLWGLLGELLGLLHLHLSVQILEFELSEDGVGVVKVEDLWVVNDEDEAISFLEGNSGDSGKLLHADLSKGLLALLLVS